MKPTEKDPVQVRMLRTPSSCTPASRRNIRNWEILSGPQDSYATIHGAKHQAPSTRRQALLDFWRSLGDFRYRSLVMKLHEMWLLSLKQQLLDIPDSSVKVKQPLNEILGNKNNMGMIQNGGRTPNSYVHL